MSAHPPRAPWPPGRGGPWPRPGCRVPVFRPPPRRRARPGRLGAQRDGRLRPLSGGGAPGRTSRRCSPRCARDPRRPGGGRRGELGVAVRRRSARSPSAAGRTAGIDAEPSAGARGTAGLFHRTPPARDSGRDGDQRSRGGTPRVVSRHPGSRRRAGGGRRARRGRMGPNRCDAGVLTCLGRARPPRARGTSPTRGEPDRGRSTPWSRASADADPRLHRSAPASRDLRALILGPPGAAEDEQPPAGSPGEQSRAGIATRDRAPPIIAPGRRLAT